PGALRAATRAVALHDEELGLFGIARRAVGELAGHRRRLEQRLAPREITRLTRREPRARGLRDLRADELGVAPLPREPVGELLVRDLLDQRPHLGVTELGLRLTLELRVAQLHADDRR